MKTWAIKRHERSKKNRVWSNFDFEQVFSSSIVDCLGVMSFLCLVPRLVWTRTIIWIRVGGHPKKMSSQNQNLKRIFSLVNTWYLCTWSSFGVPHATLPSHGSDVIYWRPLIGPCQPLVGLLKFKARAKLHLLCYISIQILEVK